MPPPCHREIELKLAVPEAARDRVEAWMRGGHAPVTQLQARYVDTPQQHLARAGLALRMRREGSVWIQTLKAADGPDPVRFEHSVPVEAPAGIDEDGAPAIDPARHAGTDVGDGLIALCAGMPLIERCRSDIRRRTREWPVPGGRIEFAWDQGTIQADGRTEPVCELELELLEGDPRVLIDAAQPWIDEHGLWLDQRSKSARGDRLAAGAGLPPATRAPAIRLRGCRNLSEIFRTVLANGLAHVLPNACEVADGRFDEEHLHQLRVGLRRLRTALRFFEGLLPDIDPDWEPALADSFRLLGAARDADAIDDAIAPLLQGAGAPLTHLPPAPVEVDPARVVRAPGLGRVLLALQGRVWAPIDTERIAKAKLAKALGWRLHVWHHRIIEETIAWSTLDEAARHRLRRRVKRLRYAVDFCASLYPPRRVARFAAAIATLQTQQGAYSDVVMAEAHYRRATSIDPQAWFAVGWLTAQRETQSRLCEAALRAFRDVRPCWVRD